MLGSSPAPLPPMERIVRLTTDQYFDMIKTGIIPECSSYELLDGLIVLEDRGTRGDPVLSYGERIGRLTTDDYFRMIQQGVIREGAPYELLDGLIVLKDRSKKGEPLMSIGDDHTLVVGLLAIVGAKLAGRGCFMQIQCPVRLSAIHAPEPDGAIVRGTVRDYTKRPALHPMSVRSLRSVIRLSIRIAMTKAQNTPRSESLNLF